MAAVGQANVFTSVYVFPANKSVFSGVLVINNEQKSINCVVMISFV